MHFTSSALQLTSILAHHKFNTSIYKFILAHHKFNTSIYKFILAHHKFNTAINKFIFAHHKFNASIYKFILALHRFITNLQVASTTTTRYLRDLGSWYFVHSIPADTRLDISTYKSIW